MPCLVTSRSASADCERAAVLLTPHVQVAANDEICKSFAEAGGVSVLLQLLSAATEAGPPELVRGAAAALRQLANSDSIKAQLAEEGVLPVLMRWGGMSQRVISSSGSVTSNLSLQQCFLVLWYSRFQKTWTSVQCPGCLP